MSSLSNTTTDHETIRKWVEERKGKPAQVEGTGNKKEPGVLRIDFPGNDSGRLQEISWDEFFKKFDDESLAFLYQEKTADGEVSYFNKLISRENESK
ncbi:hypothetical protein [Chitinophaga sp.]|uniref:hypothetical protein n=1 Tax=Chitinophaga sp. TaxID=1869181 RepID=UPI0031DBC68C